MPTAKDIVLQPIPAKDANELVKRVHYSGKVVQNSQLHIGVFLHGRLEGAMQFGPSLDKRKIQGLVNDTLWHEFVELNRMAFSEVLPRNSESRAISIAMKLLKRHAPQIKWVVSFADATQCGDGTIYRASGFVLTGIKRNDRLLQLPTGEVISYLTFDMSGGFGDFDTLGGSKSVSLHRREMLASGYQKTKDYLNFRYPGWYALPGYQLRYIYFIDQSYRQRLAVPELPYSEIDRLGAGMYKGEKRNHADVGEIESR
jgi:hypothetical protein